jgi:protein gp37
MGETTIEWTDFTFNPWEGCQKVGPGCDHCYAEARDQRFTGGAHWGPGAPRRLTSDANWKKPLQWNAQALKTGRRFRVFCASLADVFDNAVYQPWRQRLWHLIRQTPALDWQLLTKRPGNIAAMLPPDWGNGWPHVWLGCTVVNQAEADRDVPKLLSIPARVHFLSVEPMLGRVRLDRVNESIDTFEDCGGHPDPAWPPDTHDATFLDALRGMWRGEARTPDGARLGFTDAGLRHEGGRLNWIICGGESGPRARPMNPDWARSLRDQCQQAGVPFFMKQMTRKAEIPADLLVREFPDG